MLGFEDLRTGNWQRRWCLIPACKGGGSISRPTVDALARHRFTWSRFHLNAQRSRWLRAIRSAQAMTAAGLAKAAISAASRSAARRAAVCGDASLSDVEALVLASTPRPRMQLRPRHAMYARAPRLFGPVFVAETPWRVRPELRWPHCRTSKRAAGFHWDQVKTLIQAPLSFTGMAARATADDRLDTAADCARITAPTLVITGERGARSRGAGRRFDRVRNS